MSLTEKSEDCESFWNSQAADLREPSAEYAENAANAANSAKKNRVIWRKCRRRRPCRRTVLCRMTN
jgi:hypothetical protein